MRLIACAWLALAAVQAPPAGPAELAAAIDAIVTRPAAGTPRNVRSPVTP